MSIDSTHSTEAGRKGRRRDPTVFACNQCGETRPQEFYSYRPTSCRTCHIRAVLRSRDPERHRAAQRRYRERLSERGGELQRADERDLFTDAVTAASQRLAKKHPSEYIETHDVAAGSFSRDLP